MLDNLYLKLAFLVSFISLLIAQFCLHYYIDTYDEFESVTIPEDKKMSSRTIESFGYKFNEQGQLRKLKESGEITNEPFEFKISENHVKNQENYENLGEAITEYVYKLLETEVGLKKIFTAEDPQSFFYASEDALTNTEKLLIIIHGSGVVRAGQWARSLIINDNLDSGTQIPYIKKAKSLGYAVIVTNSNHEFKSTNNIKPKLNPMAHMECVWKEYISRSPAKFKAVVAHSYGGLLIVELVKKWTELRNTIKVIAMTDSVHNIDKRLTDAQKFLISSSKNWISSKDPLDVEQETTSYDIPRVSAGTTKHEYTSHFAINSVFDFIESKNV